jgi:hypothetical protein
VVKPLAVGLRVVAVPVVESLPLGLPGRVHPLEVHPHVLGEVLEAHWPGRARVEAAIAVIAPDHGQIRTLETVLTRLRRRSSELPQGTQEPEQVDLPVRGRVANPSVGVESPVPVENEGDLLELVYKIPIGEVAEGIRSEGVLLQRLEPSAEAVGAHP